MATITRKTGTSFADIAYAITELHDSVIIKNGSKITYHLNEQNYVGYGNSIQWFYNPGECAISLVRTSDDITLNVTYVQDLSVAESCNNYILVTTINTPGFTNDYPSYWNF